jgi:hypothetical protein
MSETSTAEYTEKMRGRYSRMTSKWDQGANFDRSGSMGAFLWHTLRGTLRTGEAASQEEVKTEHSRRTRITPSTHSGRSW